MMLFESILCSELKIVYLLHEEIVSFGKLYGLVIISLSFSCQAN